MRRFLPAMTLALGVFGVGGALAGPRCDVPLANWQPREVLQRKLEAEGWKATRIKTDDGCYKVRATNDKGERLKGTYDPATLQPLRVVVDDD